MSQSGPTEQDPEEAARFSDAEVRDQAATARDVDADARDRRADAREGASSAAAEDRREAAGDRAEAAADRDVARRERDLADLDELTGALRRGVGLAALERELARAARAGAQLVVAYVDVDRLKLVNDAQGHAAGDDLLRHTTAVMRSQLRSYDLLIRMGGDEFVCVLTGITTHEARRRFAAVDRGLATGSISVGFAERMEDDTADALIQRADDDLLLVRGPAREA